LDYPVYVLFRILDLSYSDIVISLSSKPRALYFLTSQIGEEVFEFKRITHCYKIC